MNDITQSKIVAFAKVLKTSPAYLMGWEEPGESKSFSSYPRSVEDELCDMIHDFNEEGKEKVLEYAKDLKGNWPIQKNLISLAWAKKPIEGYNF